MSTTGMRVPGRSEGRPPYPRPAERGWRICLGTGVTAAAAGLACMIWPGHSIDALVRLIALALLVQAIGSIVTGHRSRGLAGSGTMILSGVLLGLVAAFMAWHPGLTGELIIVVAGGAVLVAGLTAAWLGTVLRGWLGSTRWLQIGGLVGAVIGLVFLVPPRFGAAAMGVLIGVVMVLFGAGLIALALRLRRWRPGPPAAPQDPTEVVIEGDVEE